MRVCEFCGNVRLGPQEWKIYCQLPATAGEIQKTLRMRHDAFRQLSRMLAAGIVRREHRAGGIVWHPAGGGRVHGPEKKGEFP